jgi:hypothetical protein
MGKKRSLVGFVNIAGFAGIDNGKVHVEPLEVGVNQEVRAPNLKHQSRIFGKRLEIHEVEDDTPVVRSGGQMSAYRKDLDAEQNDVDGGEALKTMVKDKSSSSDYEAPRGEDVDEVPQQRAPMGRFEVLKNFVDNVAAQGRLTQTIAVVGLLVAAVALIVGVIAVMA